MEIGNIIYLSLEEIENKYGKSAKIDLISRLKSWKLLSKFYKPEFSVIIFGFYLPNNIFERCFITPEEIAEHWDNPIGVPLIDELINNKNK